MRHIALCLLIIIMSLTCYAEKTESNSNDDVWSKCCYSIVLNGSYHKYLQNKELRDFLLSTKNKILVETSPYDKIWGFDLMEIRSELRRVL